MKIEIGFELFKRLWYVYSDSANSFRNDISWSLQTRRRSPKNFKALGTSRKIRREQDMIRIRKSSSREGWLVENTGHFPTRYLTWNLLWEVYTGNNDDIIYYTKKRAEDALRYREHSDKLGENLI
jgi:hypothetical protein